MSTHQLKTHQNAPQPQIGEDAMADVIQLAKTLKTPYLRELRRVIDTEIADRFKSDRTNGALQIQKIADDLGLTVEELMSGAPRARKTRSDAGKVVMPAEMKYRNPDDESKQWSGRGLAPKWVKNWEEEHGSREGLLITKV